MRRKAYNIDQLNAILVIIACYVLSFLPTKAKKKLPEACLLTLLTTHVIKHFFLINTSSHGTLVMQLFYIIRSMCAAFRLIVVFFFNAHCNIVVVVVIAVFVRFQSVFSRKQCFFSYWSCSTNSFFIQIIGSCMHARLCMFLVWFVVVLSLLLLQTAHDGRRRHHCFSCYLELGV